MKTITLDMVMEGLKAAVEKNGIMYIDPRSASRGCQYAIGGEASCIAAVVLNHNGVPVEVLQRMDWHGQVIDADNVLADLEGAGFKLEGRPLQVLRVAQGYQDSGDTWGIAYDMAHEMVREML